MGLPKEVLNAPLPEGGLRQIVERAEEGDG